MWLGILDIQIVSDYPDESSGIAQSRERTVRNVTEESHTCDMRVDIPEGTMSPVFRKLLRKARRHSLGFREELRCAPV